MILISEVMCIIGRERERDIILHYVTYTGGELFHSSGVESSEASS